MLPRVGIVYVPFKNTRHFPEVVESWRTLTYPKSQIIIYIIPNSDPEGMISEIERIAREATSLGLPEIKIIADGKNDGFAGNHNKGIRVALQDGCEYVFLNNGDLKLDSRAIDEAVSVAEADLRIGSVQSLMLYWNEPDTINAFGGVFHIAGYGYADGNRTKCSEISFSGTQSIGYASGGAVLY